MMRMIFNACWLRQQQTKPPSLIFSGEYAVFNFFKNNSYIGLLMGAACNIMEIFKFCLISHFFILYLNHSLPGAAA